MTQLQCKRLLQIANRLGVKMVRRDDFLKIHQMGKTFKVQHRGECLVVPNLVAVATLNSHYNELFDNHKFWYEQSGDNYVMF
jgi:hypothetical protein